MLNAGFQYLEQRDANDTITKNGVVGKNSPFSAPDNSGIYDVIAEDLRWLKENIDDVKDTSDLLAIKQSVTDMYNTMKNDSSFGEATAKAQAEEAKKQAQAALESATNAKTYYDDITAKSTEVNDTIAEIKSYIGKAEALNASNKELEQSISDSATVATNKANSASTSATNAATSETNAKASETKAKASETNAKVSETNAATSESNAKAHMDATALSETNAKTSETNAKASQTASKTSENNAKTSETNAKQYSINSSNSSDLSRAWAESSDSPDSVNDTDSTTGKTQSSKTWAIYSKDRAISAFKSETNAKASEKASKTSETNAADSASKAKASETSASTSAVNAATSASNAKTSETNAKASETNASASKTDAATSETNAKSYMATAKEYMQKAQEALAAAQAIQSLIDTSKANAEKCLADVEAVKESLAKMITYQGSVDNYSDLPTNPQVGYSYNVKNADKTHGVNAGDNLVWNGTDWDNFGSYVDMSLFAELGKDVRFNSVTATLNGNAATASKLLTPRTLSLTGKAAGSTTFDGSANAAINVTSVNADTATKLSTARKINITGNATGAANFDGSGDVSINVSVNSAAKATNDKNGADIADTYVKHYVKLEAQDLNDIRLGGFYCNPMNVNSTAARHYPEDGHASSILVLNNGANGTDGCTQICTTFDTHNSYKREYDAATKTWSSWRAYAFTDSNVATATKLQTPRTISLTGNASGSATFDGSGNVSINTTVNESKHAVNADTATHANNVTDAIINYGASGITNNATAMASGVINNLSSLTGSNDLTSMNKLRSFVGSVFNSNWYDVISVRHRNGKDDGIDFGLLVYSSLTDTDSIKYKKQPHANVWTEERTILDSSNYNSYAPTKTGAGASGSWNINAATATNADTVDGVHAGSMFYNKGNWAADNWATMGAYQTNGTPPSGDWYGWGQVISSSTDNTRFQLYASDNYASDGRLHYRTGWIDRKNQWNTILDSENYNNFAPTKTGSGASGTWGINISGNAASASSVAWGNVTGKPTGIVKVASWDGSTLSLTSI